MSSSASQHHNDMNVEATNSLSSHAVGDPQGDNSHSAAPSSQPLVQLQAPSSSSQRSVQALLDEESLGLYVNASPMQDLLDGLQNREHGDCNVAASIVTPPIADHTFCSPLHSMEEGSLPLSNSSFISPQNLHPMAPPVFETRSSQRRRLSQSRQRRHHHHVTNTTSPSLSNNSLGSNNSNFRRPTSSNDSPSNAIHGNSSGNNSSNNSLRPSLDAGMAAVQRWIRSRSSNNSAPSEPSSGRSVTWSGHRDSNSEVVSLSSRSGGATVSHFGVDEESFVGGGGGGGHRAISHVHPTIFEEDEDALGRQRALSESDALRIRDFFRTMRGGNARRRRSRRAGAAENNARQLSSSAAAALHNTASATTGSHAADTSTDMGGQSSSLPTHSNALPPADFLYAYTGTTSLRERSVTDGDVFRSMEPFETSGSPVMEEQSSVSTTRSEGTGEDPERQARIRWIQINRRFQLVITFVALLFSLLLFAILICWVVLTSAYVVCFDKSCDVPLKPYFWLVTFQLVLDVFRTDIMRFVFSWDSSSNQRIPSRVIVYNVAYLLYALLVLRLGIRSVYTEGDPNCRSTAPELYNASTAFVSLSIGAWATIICGYLLPFFVVAALLTCNGYNPSSRAHQGGDGPSQPVFPAAYSTTGAPSGTIESLNVLRIEDFPDDYPRECCICMESLAQKTVVETTCKHVFHKQCCREWLRQARSCPVCRTDIPSAYGDCFDANNVSSNRNATGNDNSRIPIGPTGRPVVGLWRALRPQSFGTSSSSEHAQA